MSTRDPYLLFLFQDQEDAQKQDSKSSPSEETDPFTSDDPVEPNQETDPFGGENPEQESNTPTPSEGENESTAANSEEASNEVTSTQSANTENNSGSNNADSFPSPIWLLGLIPLALIAYLAMRMRGKRGRRQPPKRIVNQPLKRRFREKVTPQGLVGDGPANELDRAGLDPSNPVAEPAAISGFAAATTSKAVDSFRTEEGSDGLGKSEQLSSGSSDENEEASPEEDMDGSEEESLDFESGDFELGQPTSEVKSDAIADAIENNQAGFESGSFSDIGFDDAESAFESIEAGLSNDVPGAPTTSHDEQPVTVESAADVNLKSAAEDAFDLDDMNFEGDLPLANDEMNLDDIKSDVSETFEATAPSSAISNIPPNVISEGHDASLELSDDDFGSFDDIDLIEQPVAAAGEPDSEASEQESAEDIFDSGGFDNLSDPSPSPESASEVEHQYSPNYFDESSNDQPTLPAAAVASGLVASQTFSSNETSPSTVSAGTGESLVELAAMQRERDALISEKEELAHQLAESQSRVDSLTVNDKLPEMESELESLRQQLETTQAETTELQQQITERESSSLDEAEERNQKIAMLTEELDDARANVDQVRSEIPEHAKLEWESAVSELQSQLAEQQYSFQSKQDELEDAQRQLNEVNKAAADTDIVGSNSMSQLSERKTKIAKLQKKLRQKMDLVNTLEAQNEQANESVNQAKHQADEVEHQLFDLKQKQTESDDFASQLQKQLSEVDSRAVDAEQQASDLRNTLESVKSQVAGTEGLSIELGALKQQLVESGQTVSSLEKEVESARADRETSHSESQRELAELKEQLASIQDKNDLLIQQQSTSPVSESPSIDVGHLEESNTAIRKVEDELKTFRAQMESDRDEKQRLVVETESVRNELQSFKQEAQEARQLADTLRQQVGSLKDELQSANLADAESTSLKKQVVDFESTQERLENDLKQRSMEVQQVSQRMNVASSQADTLREQLAVAQQKLQEFQVESASDKTRLAELEAEHRAAKSQTETAQQQLHQWQSAANFANEQKAQIDTQQSQISTLLGALDSAGKLSKLQSEHIETKLQLEKQKATRKKPAKSTAKPTDGDDLTLIAGIGKVLQTRLRKAGITRFDQIATWTASDIERVTDKLDLKGRVLREKWVSQAKQLARPNR